MPVDSNVLLDSPLIRSALKQAWQDSKPGIIGGHEEGGFIVRDSAGNIEVVRWLKGAQDNIFLPHHAGCRIDSTEIVATFHTHPNTGPDYLQAPSETDTRAVRDDPDLKGDQYIGELVISRQTIYLITPQGHVRDLAEAESILA
jgi:hypothetical protein